MVVGRPPLLGAQKISSLVKCSPPNSGDRGVRQQTTNANDSDISEESQRELALGDLKRSAQRALAAGVLKQAAQDLRRFHGATSAIERDLYLDAYRWVISDDYSWPFSFLNVCQLLKLTPEILRQDLLDEASVGLFGYLCRRGARIARSLQGFANRIFTRRRLSTAVDPVPLTRVPIT